MIGCRLYPPVVVVRPECALMSRSLVRLVGWLPLLGLTASVGCFGGAHNPGYFPNIIPPGDVIQTHAKPPGGAYFRDFDPKAIRLDVTPTQVTNKPGGHQVFIATVSDKDGQPRRSRRVEWMIEGPGNIVEVDESGWTAGRGYKVNNKYAISYTDYFEHTITRGNSDPRDDFVINPGQTWCVVSSAVPGETVLTAYAPGVFDWEKGRVIARVNWGDASEFTFPPITSGRIGGETELSTLIKKVAEKEGVSPSDLRVRYRIAGGVPAELVPPPQVSAARAGIDSLDVTTLADGRAPVTVKQMTPKAGRTDIAVEVVKPADDGVGSGKVVGRSTTAIEWTAPALSVEVLAPPVLGRESEGMLTLVVTNTGKVDGAPSTVAARFSGYDVLPEENPTDRRGEEYLAWSVPSLPAGGKKELRMRVRPNKDGRLTVEARAWSDDGLNATARGATEVGTPSLAMRIDPKLTASVGERVPVKVIVANSGDVPLDTVVATARFGSGLEHDTGDGAAEATVGVVPAGESRSVTIPLIARRTGTFPVQVSVRSGSLADTKEMSIDVRRPELKLAVQGPAQITPGSDGTFEVGLTNSGDVTVPNVTVRASLPNGLTARDANENGTVSPGSVVWRVGDVPPGGRRVFRVSALAEKMIESGVVTASATSGDPESPAGGVLNVKADAAVSVRGKPALTLELADPSEPVPVGRRAGYRVVVRNRGSGPANDVKVTVFLPDEYANARGVGSDQVAVKPEGNKIIFPAVREIPANATVTMYVEVEGAKVGSAKVRAEVVSKDLAGPLSEEQSTRVVERR